MAKIVTSESVNVGHPDKTCDIIADSFLDAALERDPNAQMAVECAIKDDLLMIYGEATTTATLNYENIARAILRDIGYTNTFRVIKQVSMQSPDITQAVVGADLRANDQGIIFGYATNETPELMPLPIMIAHKLMKQYEAFRRSGVASGKYFADAKSQVSVEYSDDDKPVRIDTVLVSVSHDAKLKREQIEYDIRTHVIDIVLKKYESFNKQDINIIINPSGRFTIWGSFGDSGCVGRKIVVDTYGGVGRVGGGCFSSKNATKVDRSGAYYARYVAKNIVAHGFADRCEVALSYGIGIATPLSLHIETFGTEKKSKEEILEFVNTNFDFKLGSIIKELNLLAPIYRQTACYGHFGRDGFTWEQIKRIN